MFDGDMKIFVLFILSLRVVNIHNPIILHGLRESTNFIKYEFAFKRESDNSYGRS
jgi:hypothetical protein